MDMWKILALSCVVVAGAEGGQASGARYTSEACLNLFAAMCTADEPFQQLEAQQKLRGMLASGVEFTSSLQVNTPPHGRRGRDTAGMEECMGLFGQLFGGKEGDTPRYIVASRIVDLAADGEATAERMLAYACGSQVVDEALKRTKRDLVYAFVRRITAEDTDDLAWRQRFYKQAWEDTSEDQEREGFLWFLVDEVIAWHQTGGQVGDLLSALQTSLGSELEALQVPGTCEPALGGLLFTFAKILLLSDPRSSAGERLLQRSCALGNGTAFDYLQQAAPGPNR